MSSRKRKHRTSSVYHAHDNTESHLPSEEHTAPDLTLFIQAHEADVVRGPQARVAAQSLEVTPIYDGSSDGAEKPIRWKAGDALIRWGGEGVAFRQKVVTGLTIYDDDNGIQDDELAKEPIWVDRYDARLLLDSLPSASSDPEETALSSPTGWSDLPSDTEDTFFFTPDETEEYRREKKRRLIDRSRVERMKAIRAEEGEDDTEEEDVWGGSDEEADEPQKELMRRTATHLLSSPNPAQLEMRILANHGGDKRFAFLRGRWSRAWEVLKGKARIEKEDKEREQKTGLGLGGLAGYGDSDGGSDDERSEGGDSKHEERDAGGGGIETDVAKDKQASEDSTGTEQDESAEALKEAS